MSGLWSQPDEGFLFAGRCLQGHNRIRLVHQADLCFLTTHAHAASNNVITVDKTTICHSRCQTLPLSTTAAMNLKCSAYWLRSLSLRSAADLSFALAGRPSEEFHASGLSCRKGHRSPLLQPCATAQQHCNNLLTHAKRPAATAVSSKHYSFYLDKAMRKAEAAVECRSGLLGLQTALHCNEALCCRLCRCLQPGLTAGRQYSKACSTRSRPMS